MGAYRHNIRRYRRAYGEKRGVLCPPFASTLGAPRAQRDTADIADNALDFLHRERSEIRRMLACFLRMLALPKQGACSPLLPALLPLAVCLRPRTLRYRSPLAPRAPPQRAAPAPPQPRGYAARAAPARRPSAAHATRLRRGRGSPAPHALRACAAAAPRAPRCARRAREGAAGWLIAYVMSDYNDIAILCTHTHS